MWDTKTQGLPVFTEFLELRRTGTVSDPIHYTGDDCLQILPSIRNVCQTTVPQKAWLHQLPFHCQVWRGELPISSIHSHISGMIGYWYLLPYRATCSSSRSAHSWPLLSLWSCCGSTRIWLSLATLCSTLPSRSSPSCSLCSLCSSPTPTWHSWSTTVCCSSSTASSTPWARCSLWCWVSIPLALSHTSQYV